MHDESAADLGGSALAEVFRRHHRALVRSAYLLLGDASDAEEAVQEAYFRVQRAVQRAGTVDAALPYVRAAVLNVCRSGLRRRVVALRRRPDSAPDAMSAEAHAIQHEDHAEIADALRRLPARQRECLVLRYYLDLSEAEIAATLDISPGSVKTHVHRGLASLGHRLEDR